MPGAEKKESRVSVAFNRIDVRKSTITTTATKEEVMTMLKKVRAGQKNGRDTHHLELVAEGDRVFASCTQLSFAQGIADHIIRAINDGKVKIEKPR